MSRVEGLGAVKLALAGRSLWQQDGAVRIAEPIAVVGMGMRFPNGIDTPEKLWETVVEGRDEIREVPADRWDLDDWFDSDPATPGRVSTRWGSFLNDVRGFDAQFFDISPREAERMDPQQRVALEVACEALERAGVALPSLRGSSTGVFFSSYHNDYGILQYEDLESISSRTLTGTLHSVIPNRISYALGLRGPSMTVDSACSSSLVSTHLACQALRSRDCELAIVGGVNLMITPHVTVALSKGGFMSPTGHCWTFDANADGFVRAEGCAVVVLKRLSDAIAAGDSVLGVIRGSAVNQDGTSTTLSAPNGLSQADLVRAALRNAGLTPNDISLLEAHGTGTELGDPIETDALGEVYARRDPSLGPCWLGSLKSNFGHMEAAAGLAGLIKTLLVLRHGVVPPHALFTEANPHLNLDDRFLRIAREATPLEGPSPRRAGISAFGVGGTNAHVIVEEAPAALARTPEPVPGPYLLPLSARSEPSLRQLAGRYAERVRDGQDPGLLARGAARRRGHHAEQRAAVAGNSAEALLVELDRLASGERPVAASNDEPAVCFVFSGQGTQWHGMALGLRAADPAFAEELDRVEAAFASAGGLSPLAELERAEPESRLDRTDVAQAVMFAIQVALLRVLERRGVRPAMVIGHSVGEIAAAHAAGLLSLNEAVRAVLDRGAAMQASFDSGRMIAVRLSEVEAEAFVREGAHELTVSAVNAPRSVVLSGAPAEVEAMRERLATAEIRHSVLDVRFGFHSELMSSAEASLRSTGRAIEGMGSASPFISAVTGAERTSFDYGYLADNVRSPVRFAAAVQRALDLGVQHFLEIGPHPALGNAIVETAEEAGIAAEIAYTQHRERDAVESLLAAIGRLYEWGLNPDWSAVLPGPCPPVDLPVYPWDHKPYWLPERRAGVGRGSGSATTFPGRRVASPLIDRPSFEIEAEDPILDAFRDHRVGGESRLPATALLELMRSAAVTAGNPTAVVRDAGITRPVEPASLRRIQVIVGRNGVGAAEVYVETAEGEWETAASAQVESGESVPAPAVATELERGEPGETAALYAVLESAGLDFGPEFRLLAELRGEGEHATGRIESDRGPRWRGGVNPVALDAASHLCIAILRQTGSALADRALLPFAVDRFRALAGGGEPRRARATLRRADEDGASFDVALLDEQGEPVALLEGWRLRRASVGAPPLRQPTWESAAIEGEEHRPGRWIVIPDGAGVADRLSDMLRERGHAVEVVDRAEGALENALKGDAVTGVLHLAALDDDGGDAAGGDVVARATALGEPLAVLARTAASGGPDALRVVVGTRGVQRSSGEPVDGAPSGAAALGMLRALRAELPEASCLAVDLEPRVSAESAATILLEEALSTASGEVVRRGDERWVHRTTAVAMRPVAPAPIAPAALVHGSPGTLEAFALEPLEREAVPAGHVRVRVLAAGLNFRDVLIALGTYPGGGAMGLEACGVVVERGEGVAGLEVGERVLVFSDGCFASEVIAPAEFVYRAPSNLSPVQNATLPVAYGTAWYALVELGRVREGSSVLIHAGAGGVGQAAIRLALHQGATVYATAGSEERRGLLREMGVAGAFDSRSTDFAEGVLDATSGEGVDVVINSLIGEMIPAGFACLKPGGRFIELGKREVLTQDEVRRIRDDVTYASFDLREVHAADATVLPRIFAELRERVEAGQLTPLPVSTLPLADAEAGFRRMARAQHVGKIVFVPPAASSRLGWTVLTGGTGSLGEATLRWLLGSGVRRVAVWSRSGATPEVERRFAALAAEHDAEVVADAVDVADAQRVANALNGLRATGQPITGVIHAAGVLDDGTLAQLTPERIVRVLRPKVAGAWNLHTATLSDPIDTFVLYSAIGSLMDGAGQGSYSAGNAFLDALAARRRDSGLPALSIRWGLFRGGMADTLDAAARERWERKGLDWLDEEQAGEAFRTAITLDAPTVLAVRLTTSVGGSTVAATSGAAANLVERLRALPATERTAVAVAEIRETVTGMLGLATLADPEAPLRDLGLDSLSAIELRNALTVAAGVSLPATLAFDHPTISAMARFVLDRTGLAPAPQAAESGATPEQESETDDIDALSEEEAEAELLAELAAMRTETSEAAR